MWRTFIVMSAVNRENLPTSLGQGGATRLCTITSILRDQGVDMKVKNKHWYSRGQRYLSANFGLKVVVGAADIKFQLVTKDGRVFSNEHKEIEIKWENPTWDHGEDKELP